MARQFRRDDPAGIGIRTDMQFPPRASSLRTMLLDPPAQRRVVRYGEIEAEQSDDGSDQSLGLTQCQAEHGPQRQGGRYRQTRVTRLPATGGPRLGAPGRDRGLGEPDRQAAATAQAGVVRSPVRDPMALLRNIVTAVSEALERQRGILDGRRHRQALSLPQAADGWRSMQQSGVTPEIAQLRLA